MYCDFPDCLGVYYMGACCGVRMESECNKWFCGRISQKQTCCLSPKNDDCCGEDFFSLCSCAAQECCILGACAFPPNDEVPLALGLCGVFCLGGEKYATTGKINP